MNATVMCGDAIKRYFIMECVLKEDRQSFVHEHCFVFFTPGRQKCTEMLLRLLIGDEKSSFPKNLQDK